VWILLNDASNDERDLPYSPTRHIPGSAPHRPSYQQRVIKRKRKSVEHLLYLLKSGRDAGSNESAVIEGRATSDQLTTVLSDGLDDGSIPSNLTILVPDQGLLIFLLDRLVNTIFIPNSPFPISDIGNQ